MQDGSQAGWLIECATLFFATFLHEDVAIVAAGLLIVEHELPPILALFSLYGGIVASDFFLYGLGRAARHNGWARRLAIGPRVKRAGRWLDEHLVGTVVLCRMVPGLLFPTYVACGWLRLPLSRFALTTMASAAIYTPVMLLLVVGFGATVLRGLGSWSWWLALASVAFLAVLWSLRPKWGVVAKVLAGGRPRVGRRFRRNVQAVFEESHQGMPPLGRLLREVARAERIPPVLFYVPLALQWIYLGIRYRSLTLPSVANPLIEAGGMWGESKSGCLRQVSPQHRCWVAAFATVTRTAGAATPEADFREAERVMGRAGLDYPVVVKPDIGWRGFGVRLISDAAELRDYIDDFPPGETIILQQPVPYDGEAGVFYVRRPDEPEGHIFSLTLRYFPYVVGDGRATLQRLILRDPRTNWKASLHLGADPQHLGAQPRDLKAVPRRGEVVRLAFIGSNRVGGLYRDGGRHITPALTARFAAIARGIPEFYFGRFDVRFKSMDRLEAGEDFAIIEINGAGSEAITVWDPELPMREVYATLFRQQALLFEVAAANRARGFRPIGLGAFLRLARRQRRLIARYPPSG